MSCTEKAIAALRAIVMEVAGHEHPCSADSYLPAHMIHDARLAIEAHERCCEHAVECRPQEELA